MHYKKQQLKKGKTMNTVLRKILDKINTDHLTLQTSEMDISVKSKNLLLNNDIKSGFDILMQSREDFLALRVNTSAKDNMNAIKEIQEKYGLELGALNPLITDILHESDPEAVQAINDLYEEFVTATPQEQEVIIQYFLSNDNILWPKQEKGLTISPDNKSVTISVPPEFSLLDDPGDLSDDFYEAVRNVILQKLGAQVAAKLDR